MIHPPVQTKGINLVVKETKAACMHASIPILIAINFPGIFTHDTRMEEAPQCQMQRRRMIIKIMSSNYPPELRRSHDVTEFLGGQNDTVKSCPGQLIPPQESAGNEGDARNDTDNNCHGSVDDPPPGISIAGTTRETIHMYSRTHVLTYTRTRTHAHTHTYTRTHTHTH